MRADRVLSRAADTVWLSMAPRDHPTIDDVLGEFLAEQRERLSARTFRNYDEVVELLRHSLDGYAYNSLDGDERRRPPRRSATARSREASCAVVGRVAVDVAARGKPGHELAGHRARCPQ
jgi:hypothetical protein